jgi:hypothetical protein
MYLCVYKKKNMKKKRKFSSIEKLAEKEVKVFFLF